MTTTEIGSESLTVVASIAAIRHTAPVPEVNRGQIDNVFLFAILAAGAKYNIATQSDDWFRTFDDTIQTGAEWVIDAGSWKRVTKTVGTFELTDLLAGGTAGAEEALVALRTEHYPIRGALRFGAVPGPEASVLFAVSEESGRPGVLTVVLGTVSFQFKSDLPVDDPLSPRPWAEIAEAYVRQSKYSIDTLAPGYDSIQERIGKALGNRVKKYLYRTPIK